MFHLCVLVYVFVSAVVSFHSYKTFLKREMCANQRRSEWGFKGGTVPLAPPPREPHAAFISMCSWKIGEGGANNVPCPGDRFAHYASGIDVAVFICISEVVQNPDQSTEVATASELTRKCETPHVIRESFVRKVSQS